MITIFGIWIKVKNCKHLFSLDIFVLLSVSLQRGGERRRRREGLGAGLHGLQDLGFHVIPTKISDLPPGITNFTHKFVFCSFKFVLYV